jgi:hypothetical protein
MAAAIASPMFQAKPVRYRANAVHIHGRFGAAGVATLSDRRAWCKGSRDGFSFHFALLHGCIRHSRAVLVSVVAKVADLPPQRFLLSEVLRFVHFLFLMGMFFWWISLALLVW